MANKKIQDLPSKGTTIAANDILEVSEYQSPGVYISKKILGSELGGVTSFEDLTDTFTFAGNELETVRVNAAGTALETYTPATASTGRFGIADSSGVYTYYTTLTLAMTAATSGQTIEFFTDYTETGAVTVTLKDGVTINGNGHTYTLSNAGTTNALTITTSGTYQILNLKVVRSGSATVSLTQNLAVYATAASNVELILTGSLFRCNNTAFVARQADTSVVENYVIKGGEFFSANYISIYLYGTDSNYSYVYDTISKSTSANADASGASFWLSGTRGYNLKGISTSGAAIYANFSELFSCDAFSSSGKGILCVGTSVVRNSTAYSTGGIAINQGELHNCTGYSTASAAIDTDKNIFNCVGKSTASVGILARASANNSEGHSSVNTGLRIYDGTNTANNCVSISTGSVATLTATGIVGKTIYSNCTFICLWNNAGGHAFQTQSENVEIVNSTFIVTNASANCINASSAFTLKYANNAFKGATTAVNANITQGVTNTHDSQGNVLI